MKNKSLNTKGTLLLVLGFLVVVFIVGQTFFPTAMETNTAGFVPGIIVEAVIRFALLLVLGGILCLFFFGVVLGVGYADLLEKFKAQYNDSHAILVASLFVTAGMLVMGAHGVSLIEYIHSLMTRGALGLALGIVFTLVMCVLFNIRTLASFRLWIGENDNDSHAILVGFILPLCVALVMAS